MADSSPLHAPGRKTALTGRRILVVEDRYVLAKEIGRMLRRLSCDVVGPVADLPRAFDLLASDRERLDAAILDVHLGHGEVALPVAEALRRRGVPFLFSTGYGAAALPEAWRDVPRLEKPFSERELAGALLSLIA